MFGSKLVPDGLLDAVKSVTSGNQVDAAGNSIEVGTRVRIQDGPHQGKVGTVSEFKSTGRSDVQIEKGPRVSFYNEKLINEALDPVNKKAVKKKFDDREDKDLDNDGDEDESDRYLHKRRKAVGKAMKKKNGNGEKVEINPEIEEDVDAAKKRLTRAKANLADKKADQHRKKASDLSTKATSMEEVEIDEITQAQLDQAKKEGKFTKLPPRVARGARKKQTMRMKGGRPGAKELADRAEKKVSKSMGESVEIGNERMLDVVKAAMKKQVDNERND